MVFAFLRKQTPTAGVRGGAPGNCLYVRLLPSEQVGFVWWVEDEAQFGFRAGWGLDWLLRCLVTDFEGVGALVPVDVLGEDAAVFGFYLVGD